MGLNFNITDLPTPCYVVDEGLLRNNLKILKSVIDRTGCRILLAQKGFSMYHFYPLIGRYLNGTAASSLNEARLGFEEMGGGTHLCETHSCETHSCETHLCETHIFSPAYLSHEFDEIAKICCHIVFNSFEQWEKYKNRVGNAECGIRVNPEYAEVETEIYNPCGKNSRLGTTLENFRGDLLDGISGLHFHAMCEQNSDTLKRVLSVAEEKFGRYFERMKWLNFGGGHHITRPDYDIETLVECIERVQNKYNVTVYLEPGEAVALNTGFLVCSVLAIVKNGMETAILDTSAACHMPDVLEMPYRPKIIGAGQSGELPYTYRLGGPTCLAGDIIGDYSFAEPLKPGDRLAFCDMAHYTMVKNNTFNGINLPAIAVSRENGDIEVLKRFGYRDFKERLS